MLSSRAYTIGCLVAVLMMAGCESEVGGEQPPQELSVRQIVALYEGYPRLITQPIAIEAVVVSSDRFGEFRGRVVVEDSTGGVSFVVDSDALYELHQVGDILRVDCCGLTIGAYGGSVRLGAEGTTSEVAPLSVARWREHYSTVGVVEEEPYKCVKIGELSPSMLSTRLLLRSVRFVEAGEEWAPQRSNTTRHLVDCASEGDTLDVRLSGRSSFADQIIPEGECSLFGVLDCFNDRYQLILASSEDVLPHSEK